MTHIFVLTAGALLPALFGAELIQKAAKSLSMK
jgi:hypothetical protein